MKKGRAQTMTHDYKRHGTTTLFAGLSTLDGKVISRCESHHRHTEWLTFLRQIEREALKEKTLHLICDNYATHRYCDDAREIVHPTKQEFGLDNWGTELSRSWRNAIREKDGNVLYAIFHARGLS